MHVSFKEKHNIIRIQDRVKWSSYLSKSLHEAKVLKRIKDTCLTLFEPSHGKTDNLHRRKQRRRSASR